MIFKPHYSIKLPNKIIRLIPEEDVKMINKEDGYESIIDFDKDNNHIEGKLKNMDRKKAYILLPATFTDESQDRKDDPIGWSISELDGTMIRCMTDQIVKELKENEEWRKEIGRHIMMENL